MDYVHVFLSAEVQEPGNVSREMGKPLCQLFGPEISLYINEQ
jgi:hypothetical protein